MKNAKGEKPAKDYFSIVTESHKSFSFAKYFVCSSIFFFLLLFVSLCVFVCHLRIDCKYFKSIHNLLSSYRFIAGSVRFRGTILKMSPPRRNATMLK